MLIFGLLRRKSLYLRTCDVLDAQQEVTELSSATTVFCLNCVKDDQHLSRAHKREKKLVFLSENATVFEPGNVKLKKRELNGGTANTTSPRKWAGGAVAKNASLDKQLKRKRMRPLNLQPEKGLEDISLALRARAKVNKRSVNGIKLVSEPGELRQRFFEDEWVNDYLTRTISVRIQC